MHTAHEGIRSLAGRVNFNNANQGQRIAGIEAVLNMLVAEGVITSGTITVTDDRGKKHVRADGNIRRRNELPAGSSAEVLINLAMEEMVKAARKVKLEIRATLPSGKRFERKY